METWRQEMYRDELYHHGILGQRWGKRNGPPYPLDDSDKSFSEKKADGISEKDRIKQNYSEKVSKRDREGSSLVIKSDKEPAELHLMNKPGLAKILSDHFPGIEDNLNRDKNFYVKNKEGKVVGNFEIYDEGNGEMNFVWLGISANHEGKGYGQSAMRQGIQYAKDNGFNKITLEVPTRSPNARHIYEKLGFKETKEQDIFDEDDVWGGLTRMELNIAKRR